MLYRYKTRNHVLETWSSPLPIGDAQYILLDNPELQKVHSAASIRSVLKKGGVPLGDTDP
jgi:hypothetical protein